MGTDAPTTVFEFLLDLSTGFAYDVLRDRTKQLDMSEHRKGSGAFQRHSLRGRTALGPLHLASGDRATE